MNLNYNPDIPAANNNPSDDQPDMLENTNSIRTWVTLDHFGFGDNRGGVHKQTRIINQLSIPASLTSQMGTIYTKLAESTTGLSESNIYFTPGTSGNQYQLTRPVTAFFTLFGKRTNDYNGVGVAFTGGWTFLPGGILMQYGFTDAPVDNQTITYPIEFSLGNFTIQITPVISDNSTIRASVKSGSPSATGFQLNVSNNPALTRVYWVAIGT